MVRAPADRGIHMALHNRALRRPTQQGGLRMRQVNNAWEDALSLGTRHWETAPWITTDKEIWWKQRQGYILQCQKSMSSYCENEPNSSIIPVVLDQPPLHSIPIILEYEIYHQQTKIIFPLMQNDQTFNSPKTIPISPSDLFFSHGGHCRIKKNVNTSRSISVWLSQIPSATPLKV